MKNIVKVVILAGIVGTLAGCADPGMDSWSDSSTTTYTVPDNGYTTTNVVYSEWPRWHRHHWHRNRLPAVVVHGSTNGSGSAPHYGPPSAGSSQPHYGPPNSGSGSAPHYGPPSSGGSSPHYGPPANGLPNAVVH